MKPKQRGPKTNIREDLEEKQEENPLEEKPENLLSKMVSFLNHGCWEPKTSASTLERNIEESENEKERQTPQSQEENERKNKRKNG
ncbi:hypothetical protein V6N13_133379 [Hibiscus sabdariffa]|uniref:Uncharacterized protein n=1 Tax=Hibiscus sabdariffa TaxID=183260 RepID=A0ABR2CIL8_9ROSI